MDKPTARASDNPMFYAMFVGEIESLIYVANLSRNAFQTILSIGGGTDLPLALDPNAVPPCGTSFQCEACCLRKVCVHKEIPANIRELMIKMSDEINAKLKEAEPPLAEEAPAESEHIKPQRKSRTIDLEEIDI